jgi:V8-like Glu-specific endopeptidase
VTTPFPWITGEWARTFLFAATLVLFAAGCLPSAVFAQAHLSAKQEEEADIREELQRIIKEEPEKAADAQKALDALNQPETSARGRQARNRRERGARRIVNGLPSRSHPAVGALLQGNDPHTARAWCTGTLVGCDKFLTAAHCIADDPSPDSYLVFFQELGFFRIKAIQWEKDRYNFPYFDWAMLTLEKPVDGIAAMAINTSVEPLNGSTATIVGFGRTGGSRFDYGIKREGSVKISACPAKLAQSRVLCWRYDADVKSNSSAQNTCNADSGGGIFMRDYDGPRIIEKVFGIVSGGRDKERCMRNDLSFNVDVFQYRDWIEAAGEGRLQPGMCGHPLWYGTASEPVRKTFRLGTETPKVRFAVEAPAGATALRVAMNAEDNGSGKNEFQISVFKGQALANSNDECTGNGSGRFAFCEIRRPQPGLWTIALSTKKGEGETQVTVLFVSPK